DFYQNGNARVFQHILVAAGPTRADTNQAEATVRQIEAGLRAGRPFAEFAEQHNPDATRQDGGFLPPTPRGGFVQPFDSVAWTLTPGQTSAAVRTEFGVHFIRRPPLLEAGPRLAAGISQQARQGADSVYSAELIEGRQITVTRAAPSIIRTALSDLAKASSSSRAVVTWTGGEMTAAEFARWVGALPAGFPQRLQSESDSSLIGFARLLAQNMVMLEQADSAGIGVPEVNWQAMQLSYRVSVDQMAAELGLNGPEFSRDSTTEAQRIQLASERVNTYIDGLATGQAQRRQVLPGMAASLRAQAPNRVNAAGVARAVALAVPKWVADSTAGTAGQGAIPPGAVTPAPGGAPLPGGGQ
ncbi:MAG: peptidylprolyl isomerase, partial [Gemmatimonadales bacterium]